MDGCSLVDAVRSGALSARDICEDFVTKIRRSDNHIHALAHFDEDRVIQQALAVDANTAKGRLAGLPVGVKDIFDTFDLPTEYFSPIYRGHRPSKDCSVVARLRAQGAIVLGKTATSEFAFMTHGPARNPHGLGRTPGSSSAGSGAGMAAGFFPVALGTQTAGSLIKPASYCGSFAFKPTFGLVSTQGVKPLAPSFDTVGWYGRSVDDLRLLAEVLLGTEFRASEPIRRPLRLLVCKTEFWVDADSSAKSVLETFVDRAAVEGHQIIETALPVSFGKLSEAHQTLLVKEGVRSLAYEFECFPSLLSDRVLAMREDALALGYSDEISARNYVCETTNEIANFMSGYDALLTLSTGCEAPEGLQDTGTSDFIKTWNAMGMPQVHLPVSRGPHGMPIGLQLVGRRGEDAGLLDVAQMLTSSAGLTNAEAPWMNDRHV